MIKGSARFHAGSGTSADAGVRVVDLRSDTLTLPSSGMKEAMLRAPLGDDVYGEDPTVNAFQARVAGALGKPAGLFLPSAAMGNLIGIMTHCSRRGSEVILGSRCHVHIFEQGSLAALAGVHHRTVENRPDGTFDLDAARLLIRPGGDPHFPTTRAILVENTHNACGGRVLPLAFLKEVRSLADEFGLAVHMDGARLLNAAVALDVDPKEITKFVDSISICFSKGIGAPIGAMILGTETFVAEATRHRKVLGGAMRQVGIIAAAAHYGFDRACATLLEDHRRARRLAEGIADAARSSGGLVHVDTTAVQSNIVFLHCPRAAQPSGLTPAALSERLGRVTAAERAAVEPSELCIVLCAPVPGVDIVRLVVCLNHRDEDVALAVGKVCTVLDEAMRASE